MMSGLFKFTELLLRGMGSDPGPARERRDPGHRDCHCHCHGGSLSQPGSGSTCPGPWQSDRHDSDHDALVIMMTVTYSNMHTAAEPEKIGRA